MNRRSHERRLERSRRMRQRDRQAARARRNRLVVVVMVALLVLSLVATALVAAIDDPRDEQADDPAGAGDPLCPTPDDDPPEPVTEPYDEPPRRDLDADATYVVTLETTCGDIRIDLDVDAAPRTVENVVALVEDGYYDGTPFHRIGDGFVIQGGDPTGTGTGCVDEDCTTRLPGYTLDDELDAAQGFEPAPGDAGAAGAVEYPRGTVAMANSGPDTQGSQFFIVQADPSYPFRPDYTPVGVVVDGMDVVDDIAAGPVTGPNGDLAVDPALVIDASVAEG